MAMMVSVIVLTYNQDATIARTLDSILAQQCNFEFEIVIGEDASTDGTRSICQVYQTRFPHQVRLMPKAPNKGLIDNYFDTFESCRGKYIADCAGDDFWSDIHKLQREVDVLEADETISLVHTDWCRYDEDTGQITLSDPLGKVRDYHQPLMDGRQLLLPILTQLEVPIIHLCTALYRAELLRKAYAQRADLFRNRSFGCEDLQIAYTMARQGQIAYLPQVTLNYSIGHTSVSYSDDEAKQFRFVMKVTEQSLLLADDSNLRTHPQFEAYLQYRVYALTMHAFRSHNPQLALLVQKKADEWGVHVSYITSMFQYCMQHAELWNLALFVRRCVKIFKR